MKSYRRSIMFYVFIALSLTYSLPLALGLPVVGRVDTFEDGTTQGWGGSYSSLTPLPLQVASDGPAGPNDGFMVISTNGFHLATRNQSRAWTGDYLSVGVKAISVDLIHLTGNVDVRLQLSLFGPGGMFATVERTQPLHAQTGWFRHTFGLTARDLVHVADGTGRLEDTLRQVTRILIRHDTATPSPPRSHPPHIAASVGIDNITAVLRDYDVAWTFGHRDSAAYRLDRIEPAHTPLGVRGGENPWMILVIGQRYQVTVIDPELHPFELIARGPAADEDFVFLSMKAGVDALMENNALVDWADTGGGTVAFTLTQDLWSALQGADHQSPGYRCGIHSQTMRGDLALSE
jgi:hypothetical protein